MSDSIRTRCETIRQRLAADKAVPIAIAIDYDKLSADISDAMQQGSDAVKETIIRESIRNAVDSRGTLQKSGTFETTIRFDDDQWVAAFREMIGPKALPPDASNISW